MGGGTNYMCKACICCYTSIDTEDYKVCWKVHQQCLCVTHDSCLSVGDDGYGCTFDTNKNTNTTKELCTVGCILCQYGLKKPDACCKSAGHFLCFKQASVTPYDPEFLGTYEKCVCAVCCLQLVPNVECCAQAPKLPIMVR